jgi:hypothetical protein
MFTDNELKTTKDLIKRKRMDVLQAGDKISDLEYIKSLQTLAKLEDAVNQKIHLTEKSK